MTFLFLPWYTNARTETTWGIIQTSIWKCSSDGREKNTLLQFLYRIPTSCEKERYNLQTTIIYNKFREYKQHYSFSTGATIPRTTGQLKQVIDEVIPDNKDVILMEKICKLWRIRDKVSPLCNNRDLYRNLKKISADKNVSFELMVGITYTESHIGANFKPEKCRVHNNRWWKKAKKLDDGTMVRPPSMPLKDGCRLYHFESVEEYRTSFANTLKIWYIDKHCVSPECISRYYVRNDGTIKTQWCKNVRKFYQ